MVLNALFFMIGREREQDYSFKEKAMVNQICEYDCVFNIYFVI